MIVKLIGILFIMWGILDISAGYFEVDVWKDWLGIELTGVVYQFIGLASIVLGVFIFRIGGSDEESARVVEKPSE